MIRRTILKGLVAPVAGMLGKPTPSRFPYANRPQQAGASPGAGNTLRARVVIVSGAGGGIFVYNGTPATGNLIASIAAAAGTDAYGNAYRQGIVSYSGTNYVQMLSNEIAFDNGTLITEHNVIGDESLVINGGASNGVKVLIPFFSPLILEGLASAPAAVSGDAQVYGNSFGAASVVDGGDGQTYATERNSQVVTSGVTITTTSAVNILSAGVEGGRTYRVSGLLFLTANSAASVEFEFACNGSSTGLVGASIMRAAVLIGTNNIVPNTLTGVGGALTSGDVYLCYLDGVLNIGGTGESTLVLQGAVTATPNSFTVDVNSYLDIMPQA